MNHLLRSVSQLLLVTIINTALTLFLIERLGRKVQRTAVPAHSPDRDLVEVNNRPQANQITDTGCKPYCDWATMCQPPIQLLFQGVEKDTHLSQCLLSTTRVEAETEESRHHMDPYKCYLL